jgi:Fe-S-cluster-containing dehydrogenase component/anaerobic selenocysteine-containing dehydrogenase
MSKRSQISRSSAPARGQGPRVWRSLEEREDPTRREALAASEPEVQLDKEVQVEKSDLITLGRSSAKTTKSDASGGLGRRQFLTTGGVAAAAASLSGCLRRPVEHILPYSRQPEYVLPGIALHYATTLSRRGDAIGVIVESHEGRPTKIEGNPEHPASHPGPRDAGETVVHGGTDLHTQAQILNLYDADRSAHVMRRDGEQRVESSWAEFDEFFGEHLRGLEADTGRGLRFLLEPTSSPTLMAARSRLLERFPGASFHTYSSLSDWNAIEGARLALGRPAHTYVDYSRAKVVVSLDSDFLLTEPGSARWQHLFADARRLASAADAASMNRLYAIESVVSVTGANADHRIRVPSRDVGQIARDLAHALGGAGVDISAIAGALGSGARFATLQFPTVIAEDLAQNRGRSAIVVGDRQPPWVHALGHALNAALGNVGPVITYHDVLDADQQSPVESLRALVADMRSNAVGTLVTIGVNPVYDAPRDLGFVEALGSVPTKIHLGAHDDETAELADWHLPMAHELESWGDHRSLEGAYSIQQPMIAPLRGGRNAIELVGFASGERSWRAYHAVRRTFGTTIAGDLGDRRWRDALQRGIVAGTPVTTSGAALGVSPLEAITAGAAREMAELGDANWEVTFVADNKVLDGRWANNPWLLELPDPISKVSWDNAAAISWGSARALGVRNGDLLRIEREGAEAIEIAAVIVPGMADHSVALPLGWGRRRGGQYAVGKGFDVHPARTADAFSFGEGYRVSRAGGTYPLSMTQEHHSMEGRPIAVDATVAEYQETPDFGQWAIPQPSVGPLWTEVDYDAPHPPAQGGKSYSFLPENRGPDPDAGPRHAWGMGIDLTTCVGCNACAIACIAENNIPVVGKDQVARGREMHWMRIDRYFTEAAMSPRAERDDHYDAVDEDHLRVAFQPIACQHCEEAPCENVCPVNATAHSPEGLNEMAYNRCIGTRYCANNCPYKVRRFNYLAYTGRVSPLERMQFNPNVSVRMRGVMEKCTYCVQRIQSARITSRNEGRRIREGEVLPACAQACPSQAITFGDLNDPEHAVSAVARTDRHYKLLADVGTQPRTTFLGRIRNPNPRMERRA